MQNANIKMQNDNIKFKIFFLSIIFFGVFGLAKSSQAATIYVDNTTTSCSIPSDTDYDPATDTCGSGAFVVYDTIQGAADVVNPGDTVIVKDGTYTNITSTYIVNLTRGGTADNWITFKSENKWGAVLDGRLVSSTSYYNDNGDAYGSGSHAPAVPTNANHSAFNIGANVNYIRIQDFEIKQFRWGGIWSNSPNHDLYVYGNKIHDIGRWCYWSSTESGNSYGQAGIFTGNASSNLTVDSNLIYSIGRLDYVTCNMPYSSHWYSHDHGLYLRGADATIINNILYDCVAGWPIAIDNSNAKIVNNTIEGKSSTNPDPTGGGHIITTLQEHNGAGTLRIENNISYNPKGGFMVFDYWGADQYDGTQTVKNNLVYSETDTASVMFTYPLTPATNYIAADNIIGQNPKLVNLAGKDFHLQSNSPAINTGLATNTPSVDFDKNTRPQGSVYDIGAYEYVSGGDSTPPAAPSGLTVQ